MASLKDYHFNLKRVPNESFGTLELLNDKDVLADITVTMPRHLHPSDEVVLDLLIKALGMLLKKATVEDLPLLKNLLNNILQIQITSEGKPINW